MAMNNPTTQQQLQIFKGSVLGKCHVVEAFLGEGGFGLVSKCRNTETNKAEAIKVNKTHPEIVKQAVEEIAILKRLRCLDPDTCNIVRWNDFFFHRDHICLNFELLDQSLYSFMKERKHCSLSINELNPVIYQLATALSHLRSIGVVHADLKPDNIMVVNREQRPLKVKLIDFGLACHVSAVVPGVCVQTTWYRAPEVMLHIPFNEAIDMWSLGLVAAELATGYLLYPGDNEYDVLRYIIETQGHPADYILNRGHGTDYYFNKQSNSQQLWKFMTPQEFADRTGYYTQETRSIRLWCLDDLSHLMMKQQGYQSNQLLLVDLIKRMLQLDAELRIKPLEVLQHPIFSHSLPQSSTADPCIVVTETKAEPDNIRQPSSSQTAGPRNILRRRRVETTAASLVTEAAATQTYTGNSEEKTLKEEDVRPVTARQDGWLRRFFRGMKGFLSRLFFSDDGEENPQ